MKNYHYIEKPIYIEDKGEKHIVVDMKYISEGAEEMVNENSLSFFNGKNVFIINTDKFSDETISLLQKIPKIKLAMYKGDTEKLLPIKNINTL